MNEITLPEGTIISGKAYQYKIVRALGCGTFGITYLATMTISGPLGQLEVNVAIKEFFMRDINGRENTQVTSGSQDGLFQYYKDRFSQEAKNLSLLNHENIIKVVEEFEQNGTAYYVMEYIPGGNLNDLINKRGRIGWEEAREYTLQICSALEQMHSQGMLHLDIKPLNIMINDGKAVLIDFGLSKQYNADGAPETSTRVGQGTPCFAPLEQADFRGGNGKNFPVTMDIYALGATLFCMLTGKRPPEASIVLNEGFPEDDMLELGLDPSIVAIVKRSMAPIKGERYQSASELADALRSVLILPDDECEQQVWSPDFTTDTVTVLSSLPDEKEKPEDTVIIATEQPQDYSPDPFTPVPITFEAPVLSEEMQQLVSRAECGDTAAQIKLADNYYTSHGGLTRDYAEAARWYLAAAEKGHSGAQCKLAGMYRDGEGVDHNNGEAAKWYKAAAENGDDIAQNELGFMYKTGQGIAQNYQEAMKWFMKAAENGNLTAINNIGEMYENGQGVNKDKDEALKWYRQAEEKGSGWAQNRIKELTKKKWWQI